jgi:hypothetical protein
MPCITSNSMKCYFRRIQANLFLSNSDHTLSRSIDRMDLPSKHFFQQRIDRLPIRREDLCAL